MITIQSFSLSNLNNAEFVAFFLNLNQAIEQVGSENLGLGSQIMMSFAGNLKAINDQVKCSVSSEFTAEMQEFHDKRMNIFRRCYYRMKIVESAEQNADLNAIKNNVVTNFLRTYPLSILNKPYQEMTTYLAGFVMDCKEKLDEDAIDALSIMSDLTALEMANNGFKAAYLKRVNERVDGNSGITARLRASMQEHYDYITINVQYIANSLDEANKDKADKCARFCDVVSQLVADYKARYNQRMAYLHKNKEEKPAEGDAPSEGDKPAEDNKPSGDNNTGANTGGGVDNGTSVIF